MFIEHIAMYVDDLDTAKDFFVKYFGAVPNEKYYNENKEFYSYFLSFESGARLEIMKKPMKKDERKVLERMGYAHIAFSLGSKAAVDEFTEKMKKDGYDIISAPRTTGDGYYESRIIGIEENLIEITV